jgi:hypothetical protein
MLNCGMLARLHRTLVCLPAVAALATAAPASAEIIEIGKTQPDPVPSCPADPCLAVSKTTGYQAKVGATRGLFVVPKDGKIVAWSIALGKPGPKQRSFFDRSLGEPSKAGITVLRPGKKLFARVIGQSPIKELTPYFGQAVQFPLGRALTVRKGYLIALTVPTWAPALAVGMGNDTSWRASRGEGACRDTEQQTAQLELRLFTQYRCLYRTARLTYTATLITEPQAPADAEKPKDEG